jgi:hypothetical protein
MARVDRRLSHRRIQSRSGFESRRTCQARVTDSRPRFNHEDESGRRLIHAGYNCLTCLESVPFQQRIRFS